MIFKVIFWVHVILRYIHSNRNQPSSEGMFFFTLNDLFAAACQLQETKAGAPPTEDAFWPPPKIWIHHFDSHGPTFPVGSLMAGACKRFLLHTERRRLRVDSTQTPYLAAARSRNGDRRTWINRAALWEHYWLSGFWATAAHSSLLCCSAARDPIRPTGRHFLLKVAPCGLNQPAALQHAHN